jgi:hypothetical protein
VERADDEGVLKEAETAGGEPLPEEAAEVVKRVGSKTFLLKDGIWIDTTFDPSQMTTVKVGFGSDEYFDLLAARPDWGLYFAVGDRVIFVAEGTAYEVVEGAGGPVEIPPTLVPDPTGPKPTSPAPGNPLPESGQDQPTPTLMAGGGDLISRSRDISWAYALVAAVLVGGVSVLAGVMLWWRLRR